jgi:tetratricopeptide (TPR) repeat protein
MELDPKNFAALLNRAIANLQSDRLDDAQRDYEKLLTSFTATSFRVYYGLATVAYKKGDWARARQHYKSYLMYAPANSDEAQEVKKRLTELKKK